ncbi:hypothetical protein GF389_00900, partial [Candidatus Dojkabacteria bacterium]|nr:hypothetical protein [Candidatus Dojkabacteria bacterium]
MEEKDTFSKKVERLVDPIEVGAIHFVHGFNKLLPKAVQNYLTKVSSKKSPYMGFVVEPYSYFLCYEVKNLKLAEDLLPDGFTLQKTMIFENDEPKFYAIFGCFRAHT